MENDWNMQSELKVAGRKRKGGEKEKDNSNELHWNWLDIVIFVFFSFSSIKMRYEESNDTKQTKNIHRKCKSFFKRHKKWEKEKVIPKNINSSPDLCICNPSTKNYEIKELVFIK